MIPTPSTNPFVLLIMVMSQHFAIFPHQHEAEFLEILSGVKGGPGERRLTSQFIARFFRHFPSLQEQALNALFDLCEDADIAVSMDKSIVSWLFAVWEKKC